MKIRSRAWFKLDQINNVDCLLRAGMVVIDLGSSPGSWSEYVKNKIGKYGYILACDILPMKEISGVDFLQGDFCDPKVLEEFIVWINKRKMNKRKVDIILSDVSPNISGISHIDISRSIYFGRMALSICKNILVTGGSFLVKIFQGEGFDEYCKSVCSVFDIVKIRKPLASRIHSREVYIVAKGYKYIILPFMYINC